jgi:STE24 endopeptidase
MIVSAVLWCPALSVHAAPDGSEPVTTEPSAHAANAGVRAPMKLAPVDDAWREGLPRDAVLATRAYLDRLPTAAVERSDDYFEGRYWLQLAEFLWGLGVAALMLHGQRAARVRDWAQRVGRKAFFRDALVGCVYAVTGWLLTLPLTIYQGFVREKTYGMSTQTFAEWASEQGVSFLVSTLLTGLSVAVLYAVFRRTGERWWLWGTVAAIGMLAVLVMLSPTLIDPLFNTYKKVEDGPIKNAVLAMAKSNGVPADNVYEFDASRQSTKVSANVSGFLGTAAIRLNDNLLRRASLPEIRAVMGHEMGHYVMNHVAKMMTQFALLIMFGFLFCQWAMKQLFARFANVWGTDQVQDVASLPLLIAMLSVYMFFCTPIFNSIIRVQEVEADRFGLNLSREPHGFAESMLKLSEYRKVDPGPLEEIVFFDHPSARNRIYDAMRWREAMGTP